MSVARAGRQRRRVSAALMYVMVGVLMPSDLDLAPAALAPRYRRLRVLHVSPLPQGHAPDRHRPVCCLRLLYVNLIVVNHPLVLVHARRSLCRFLQLPAQTFLRLGHRGDGREFFQQRVSSESPLNGQRGVSRLHAAILPF